MRARTRTRRVKTRESRPCVYETEVLASVQAATDPRSRRVGFLSTFASRLFSSPTDDFVRSTGPRDRLGERSLLYLYSTRLVGPCIYRRRRLLAAKELDKAAGGREAPSLQRSRVYAFVYRATYGGSMWLVTSQRNTPIQ